MNLIKVIFRRIQNPVQYFNSDRLRVFRLRNKVFKYSHYNINVLSSFLNLITSKGFSNIHFLSDYFNKNQFYIRIDVDTEECVKNSSFLLKNLIKEGYCPAVYIRTDCMDYDPKKMKPVVEKFIDKGVVFGLHTSCYTEDNYMKKFQKELDLFHKIFGFKCSSFSVHGLGQYRKDIRDKFAYDISKKLDKWELFFSDCHEDLRKYDYVFEDCHLNKKGRHILNDFTRSPPKGKIKYLVLLHPCYWK